MRIRRSGYSREHEQIATKVAPAHNLKPRRSLRLCEKTGRSIPLQCPRLLYQHKQGSATTLYVEQYLRVLVTDDLLQLFQGLNRSAIN